MIGGPVSPGRRQRPERRFLRKTVFHEEVVVRVSIVVLLLCVVLGGAVVSGCAKPGPVRTKATTAPVGVEGDPANTAAVLDEVSKKSGVKYSAK
jgi:hypothetical protein